MNVYTTLDELKQFIGGQLQQNIENVADPVFRRYIVRASRFLDNIATNGVQPERVFYPHLATYSFDHPVFGGGNNLVSTAQGDPTCLRLDRDLLEATTLTTRNGTVLVSSADYLIASRMGWDGYRYDRTPFNTIQLQPNGSVTTFDYSGSPMQANAVTGIWGYHNDWANAFEDSTDTVQNDPLAAGDTTITVNDAAGDDINGLPVRFKAMQLLRIEDEYLWLVSVNSNDNVLTVRRGMNGTTAVEHAQGTTIEVFRPMEDLNLALETLTTYLYRRKDSIGTPDERPLAAAQGVLIMPPVIPNEVKEIMKPYKKDML